MSMRRSIIHTVRSPSRLHFTLIDMNGESGRIDGGLGVALDTPSLTLQFKQANHLKVHACHKKIAELARKELINMANAMGIMPNLEVHVKEVIPSHIGLGSGTQWRLCLLTALNHIYKCGLNHYQLISYSNRGGTSGVGIYTSLSGGILLDGGHALSDKSQFDPSDFCKNIHQPPLLLRYTFPEHWKIVLFIPDHLAGLSGKEEQDFMHANTPIPKHEAQEVSHTILMHLLPALVEKNLKELGIALNKLQYVGWKKRHWERPDLKPLEAVRSAFLQSGIAGCGLSSTGPTLFGFFDTHHIEADQVRSNLTYYLTENRALKGHIRITSANNTGTQIYTAR
ncbi:beta-ribofuranosylaminobenzene 5'-phosphate synthase family protein [Candidatus Entotheonella palauensis]|uniref:beta-ribofuranosylaminobenzene 5'-phosphate synthase family protein n=1 Tax=Candidatus Entotheonella palauensis TaxID=93172 RepID=UPI000B7D3347|nr:beta-ribofuranosylaminobenzene 5'-phosphate synthase family protein [Candidatus Entotheonella palauensis]